MSRKNCGQIPVDGNNLQFFTFIEGDFVDPPASKIIAGKTPIMTVISKFFFPIANFRCFNRTTRNSPSILGSAQLTIRSSLHKTHQFLATFTQKSLILAQICNFRTNQRKAYYLVHIKIYALSLTCSREKFVKQKITFKPCSFNEMWGCFALGVPLGQSLKPWKQRLNFKRRVIRKNEPLLKFPQTSFLRVFPPFDLPPPQARKHSKLPLDWLPRANSGNLRAFH